MDAGVFSLAVWTAYLGLLRDEDIAWLKQLVNRFAGYKLQVTNLQPETFQLVTVLYDGQCGLCLKSILAVRLFDWLEQFSYTDFRDTAERKKVAPDLTEETLDKAMHIKLSNGQYRTGFDAFRRMTWSLPPLWVAAPLLYIPGVPFIGRHIYAKIAVNRKKCTHENCSL
jgi:predicted DCC family thiol-disulfide oxidoreductase YuxK